MSWLVWRQHRWEGASALAVLLVLGGTMTVLTAASANLLAEISRACASQTSKCATLSNDYNDSFGAFQTFYPTVGLVIPALVGAFVGAPLVARELELGTHLLVWAQGITRRRWFLSKVLLIAAVTLIASALLGAVFEIWLAPQQSFWASGNSFDVEPVVLVAYSLFALALGIALGTIVERTLPAMAATLGTFVAIRFAVSHFARPIYLQPLTWDYLTSSPRDSPFLFIGPPAHVDVAGRAVSDQVWNGLIQQCSSVLSGADVYGGSLGECLHSHGVLALQQYQPESRFWLFQGIEATIFVTLALMLIAIAYRLLARKS